MANRQLEAAAASMQQSATDPRIETLKLLTSIDRTLNAILVALRPVQPETVDLDGPHGDPIIKAKDPRDWAGDSMMGARFSQCPADYLDLVADRLEYFASKEEDATKARYNRLDAARARGWAARHRTTGAPAPEFPGAPAGWAATGDF